MASLSRHRRKRMNENDRVSRKQKRNMAVAAKSLQPCLTLCNPTDGSPPGSTIPGILQARTLEWGATAFSEKHGSHPQK